MGDKVRWGVLSTAKIGLKKVIPGMQRGDSCEIVAIASRSLQKAEQAAGELGIPTAYGSYEEVLADPNVDAVYNPLPNHLHVPLSVQALQAGKHVLCEKPIALSVAEAQTLVEAGQAHPELKLMEAFMYRHHPQWRRVVELVRGGALGEVRDVHGRFSYFNTDGGDIRNQADIGGGGLMDIGCYPISVARLVYDAEPTRVLARVERDPEFKTDTQSSALLEFPTGAASLFCSTQAADNQAVWIVGTQATLRIDHPFTPAPDEAARLVLDRNGQVEIIELPPSDQYTVQGDLFSQAVLGDTEVPTPITDAVANMRVIEACFCSGESGGWETV